jgi:amidohydrolase
MLEKIKQVASSFRLELVKVRRHLHQNPELSFQEFETSKYIKNILEDKNIEVTDNVAGTGIIAKIYGNNPESRNIALRADMDALPIKELNSVEYISKNEGVMHACGHDVHSSCLLGAAFILNELRSSWNGTIQFIFQPGEEKLPGGAKKIIEEGWLSNPSPKFILGQHVEPDMEVGKIGIRPGMFMASADEIYITVIGKGGHAAKPHECVDPIIIASNLLISLQQIISRNADPKIPSVLSFGKINSDGGATNVIPSKVYIQGTFRTFDENWRKEAHQLIRKMTTELCSSMNAQCEIDIVVGYPFLKNDPILTESIRKTASEYLGKENVVDLDIRMGAEDFAYYSQIMPSVFYRLGTKNPNGTGLHSPTFDIDENALEIGAGLMAYFALKLD